MGFFNGKIEISYLKDGVHSLVEKHVEDMKDKKEGKFSSKQGQKPLRRIHMRFNAIGNEMHPQVGEVLFKQTIQLVKT